MPTPEVITLSALPWPPGPGPSREEHGLSDTASTSAHLSSYGGCLAPSSLCGTFQTRILTAATHCASAPQASTLPEHPSAYWAPSQADPAGSPGPHSLRLPNTESMSQIPSQHAAPPSRSPIPTPMPVHYSHHRPPQAEQLSKVRPRSPHYLPHPGARACAVLARLSTGPTAAGVQRAPTRLASPLCWALDAAAPHSPDCPARAPPGFPPHTPKTARHSLPPCTASSGASDKPVRCSNLPVPPRLCPRSQPSIPSRRPANSLCSALIPTQGRLHPKRQLTLLRRGPAGAPSSVLKAAARPEPASHAVRGWGAVCLAA